MSKRTAQTTLIKRLDILQTTQWSKSTLQRRINEGLFPPPIPMGYRDVRFFEHEVVEILNAYRLMESNETIKAIVKELLESRNYEKVIYRLGGNSNV